MYSTRVNDHLPDMFNMFIVPSNGYDVAIVGYAIDICTNRQTRVLMVDVGGQVIVM